MEGEGGGSKGSSLGVWIFSGSTHCFIKTNYSQLSRKRPPLVHEKVVAYGRWSLTGKINKLILILD